MKSKFLLFCLFCIAVIYPQENIRFQHISTNDGLSQSTIRCMVRDYLGFLWIGTDDGLNRYDGYSFKLYSYDPDNPNGLQSNMISSICQDNLKNLWVGTQVGGLYKYNRTKDKFFKIKIDTGHNNPRNNKILSLYSYMGYLWIGTRESGLIKLNPKTSKVEEYINKKNHKINSNNITYITGDRNGNLWLGTGNAGLIEYSVKNNKEVTNKYIEKEINPNLGSVIFGVGADKYGFIWAATNNNIIRIDPLKEKLKEYPYYLNGSKKTVRGNVFGIYVENNLKNNSTENLRLAQTKYSKSSIWAATSEGLFKYVKEKDEFKHFTITDKNNSEIKIFRILYSTGNNILWAGTATNGLYKIDFSPKEFHNYLTGKQFSPSAPVMPVIQDRKGNCWVGTFGHGLFKLDSNKNNIEKIKYQNPINKSQRSYVMSLTQDIKGNIWFGTIFNGLFKYDEKKDKFINYNTHNSSLKVNGISCLYINSQGEMLIGTFSAGLYKYDDSSDNFIDMNYNKKYGYKISDKQISCIFEDNMNNLWIGTNSSGLDRIDEKNNKFYHYYRSRKNRSLSNNNILSIQEGKYGNLWIGTYAGGLDRFNYKTSTFNYYTIKDGLPNNSIYSIQIDNSGNLWMSTNKGISRFNPENKTFANYTKADGLSANEFDIGYGFKSKNGEIFFGNVNGLTAFFPDEVIDKKMNYKIVLTGFKIKNKSVQPGTNSVLKKNISIARKINLSYNDNMFEFSFAALNYNVQKVVKYAYKLIGFNKNWIITSHNKRFASYTNLEPGHYIFKVKVINREGKFSKNEASVKIFISPPFWETWWFYTLVILTIGVILYSIYKYRLTQVLKLERLRVQIASDLHDDIGATLTKLALKSDVLKEELKDKSLNKDFGRISEMSRQAVGSMQDIVWSIDSRNDSFESMLNKMKDFAFNIMGDRDIKVDFKVSGFQNSQILPLNLRQNIYLIFKEAVNNIAKYADTDKVKIVLSLEGDSYSMIVKDFGNNFKEKEINVGHGLRNMKLRAKRIKAEINFLNNEGFTIELKGTLKA